MCEMTAPRRRFADFGNLAVSGKASEIGNLAESAKAAAGHVTTWYVKIRTMRQPKLGHVHLGAIIACRLRRQPTWIQTSLTLAMCWVGWIVARHLGHVASCLALVTWSGKSAVGRYALMIL